MQLSLWQVGNGSGSASGPVTLVADEDAAGGGGAAKPNADPSARKAGRDGAAAETAPLLEGAGRAPEGADAGPAAAGGAEPNPAAAGGAGADRAPAAPAAAAAAAAQATGAEAQGLER